MKKTSIIIYNPNINDTQLFEPYLNNLKKISNHRLVYFWVDIRTEEKQSFNIQKGLLTKLSSLEIKNIVINLVNSVRKVQENYSINTSIRKININYRIL
uniref:Uncharacterized protein n=1 Tax=Liriope tetraphylla TaxID=37524 RepID=A0A0S2IB10_9CNID|nr:hypothetical protein [Liriope tetraphylla]